MNDTNDTGTPKHVTHREVAEALGVTEGAVSRLRSGDRLPSFDLMLALEKVYGWRVEDQARARAEGQWLYAFETVLRSA